MTQTEAFESALWLAITADSQEKSDLALQLANDIGYGMTKEEIKIVKKRIESRIDLLPFVDQCAYEPCSKYFLRQSTRAGRPTTTCSPEHKKNHMRVLAKLRKRDQRAKIKASGVLS
jgi:hypothetical protein